MRFDELKLEKALLEGLEAMCFKETTPVQEHTIPAVLEGNDIIACAQTGTGKTAAFLLPILNLLCKENLPKDKINALIMVPTRELAQQIDQQLEGFAYFLPVTSIAVYGGGEAMVFEQQRKALISGVDVVIATPGRLISLLAMGTIDLSKVSFFILDEADRMLEMGFIDDIMKISSYLPKQRQTLMFSATMPEKIRQLAKKILNHPKEIRLAVSKPAEKIQQSAYICHEAQKNGILQYIFKEKSPQRTIIFSSKKQKVQEIYRTLRRMNIAAGEMHSDLDQHEREEMIRNFKNGKIKILVATDIVSRGIDIEDIDFVINYDVPSDVEDYVHRIGRTARAAAEGAAITFVSADDQWRFKKIEDFLEKEITKNEVPAQLGEAPAYNPTKGTDRNKRPFGKRNAGNNGERRKRPAHRRKPNNKNNNQNKQS
ncbi:MAG: DEAD/DEAH box helicase [Paludibacteraceae bacterium]|nr:DEAD/DEAH box helicase [Paludibacteraceae bacterium]MBR6310371.1 DEAD/DEAH box helicase [Paludibacteraceae bacterium]